MPEANGAEDVGLPGRRFESLRNAIQTLGDRLKYAAIGEVSQQLLINAACRCMVSGE